ncbi:MAG: aminotransferase class V-fold PLP-dependent enzyme [Candidatus Lokiarchaeota archaeon]|nr:aminotransferase class V-fold PLP-dependent enzyme [Candidatus Lokiarchaeota archaeon]
MTKRKEIRLPKNGLSKDEILNKLKESSKSDVEWEHGKAFGYVYHIDDEHTNLLMEANDLFASTNAMNPMAFPTLKQCEGEVISMTADMLGGDDDVVGSMTSGGTESILMAVKTYRDRARKKKKVKDPEVVLPLSAHPAFDKAGHFLDVRIKHVPICEDYRADVEKMEEAITDNTILMVGSACDYPKGVIDPIKELAAIAEDHGIGFHVDSCLGGFMLPWLKKLDYPIPDFNFKVPGVTSMSADSHKYGFGYKGSSLVLFKDKDYQKYQFFAQTSWPGGIYATPTMTGTRPGGAIAATWAMMKFMGEEGYLKFAKQTMETTNKLMDGIKKIPELHIFGDPDMTVFTFGSEDVNVYRVADLMQTNGWVLDRLQKPRCLHCIVNPDQAAVVNDFLEELQNAVDKVKDKPRIKVDDGTAAMYGLMAKFPSRKFIKKQAINYLIKQYKL